MERIEDLQNTSITTTATTPSTTTISSTTTTTTSIPSTARLVYFTLFEDERGLLLDGSKVNFSNASALAYSNQTFFIYDTYYSNPSGYSLPAIIVASIFAIVLMVFVVVGNLLVIVAIATEKSLKNIQNWFIASLAVADFFLGVLIIPFSLANELMGYWIFGVIWCDIHSAADVLLCTASIMNLCLISLDRYWSITQAIDYLKKRTRTRASFMIAFVWTLSAAICIPPLLGWKVERKPEPFPKCEPSRDLYYVVYSALGSFYIPSCIMVFVYIRIYFAAKARARRGIRKPQSRPQGAKNPGNAMSLTSAQKKTPSCITTAQGPRISVPIDTCSTNNNSPMSVTIEARPATIPIVTCDYASDASTSDNMDTGNDQHRTEARGGGKDTLHVFTTSKPPPSLNSAFRGSTLTINGDVMGAGANRCRAPSTVGIDPDLVSEFDLSSSDSGVAQKCVTVKPLRLRLCKPIFRKGTSKTKREMIDMGKLADCGGGNASEVSQQLQQQQKPTKQPKPRDPEREKRRIARKKEKRATLILGLIMGSFILCWLPFFLLYILTPICDCHIPHIAFASAFWLGYMNSALNPVIYTIFNKDFRRAFRRILFK